MRFSTIKVVLNVVFLGSYPGTGQMASVELESVSGGFMEPEIGEMRDVSAKYLVRFQAQNPETTTEKTLLIKNTT